MRCCHHCGREWVSDKKEPAVKETCEGCDAYLHACLNCKFYEPGRPNDCHIPNTDKVAVKAACNFCDEFEFRQGGPARTQEAQDGRARDKFEGLFGEGSGSQNQRSFDDLFRD